MSKLMVVGTPIGNLRDLSPRALSALNECDFIAAEDTRVTIKILNHFNIKKPMVSYHEHNRRERGEQIVAKILSGESCALVTDAGMPAISDPGEELVRQCHSNGVKVESVPGPCAFATALAISGMPSGRFTFEGFLSVNKHSRKEHIESIVSEERTMIFYEAPHKLPATLRDLAEALGDREIAIVRELTKIHEEVIISTLCRAAEDYADNTLLGEIVLIISGAQKPEPVKISLDAAAELAKGYVSGGMTASQAAKSAAKETGYKKGEIYKLLME
ncbi:MAG: 16S rRNA (cytidine(1402)-2'-O)-methyltransferase [Clostridiales bacterium]|nr:16S rRNA (cytidine(1402)-2'-O)-methyltransferase [Clostridiales bacterium]